MTGAIVQRPQSATSPWVGSIGFTVLIGLMPYVLFEQTMSPPLKAIIISLAVALAMFSVELFVFKTHRRASTGLDWSAQHYNAERIIIKLIGVGGIIALASLIYYIFPLYNSGMYAPFMYGLYAVAPYLAVGFIAYIIILDGVMKEPEDGYFALGQLILLRKNKVNFNLLAPLGRSWLIKGYFIPAMFSFLAMNMSSLSMKVGVEDWYMDRENLFGFTLVMLYTIDLIFALIGYVCAFRILDTHERSSDPTLSAWIAALFCYPPFWKFVEANFINYSGPVEWHQLFADNQTLLISWGMGILLMIVFYTWSTIVFGCRFSNLTHRGIITNGPYKFTKHPAYIAKNISWWMISLPFLAFSDPFEGIRHSIMLLMLNAIYFARAWTEERHLANDPVYRRYQDYIAQNGIFRWLNILPAERIGKTKLNPSVVIR